MEYIERTIWPEMAGKRRSWVVEERYARGRRRIGVRRRYVAGVLAITAATLAASAVMTAMETDTTGAVNSHAGIAARSHDLSMVPDDNGAAQRRYETAAASKASN